MVQTRALSCLAVVLRSLEPANGGLDQLADCVKHQLYRRMYLSRVVQKIATSVEILESNFPLVFVNDCHSLLNFASHEYRHAHHDNLKRE